MSSVNKVILVGNLGRDPEVRYAQSGNMVVNLAVATSERWKDKTSGEKKERTEWHRVVIFDQNLADIAAKYLKKGSKAYFEGQLATRKWTDQQGQERYTTEVVLQAFRGSLTLLSAAAGGPPPAAGGADDYGLPAYNGGGAGSGSAAPAKDPMDLDDDIPF